MIFFFRWINGMLLSFLNYDEDGNVDPEKSQIIPLVDGGTEGFKGRLTVAFWLSLRLKAKMLSLLVKFSTWLSISYLVHLYQFWGRCWSIKVKARLFLFPGVNLWVGFVLDYCLDLWPSLMDLSLGSEWNGHLKITIINKEWPVLFVGQCCEPTQK